MSWTNYKKSVDKVQLSIVNDLRKMGMSVLLINCEIDLLVGYNGKNYLFEVKDPQYISKKTGKILKSALTKSQKELLDTWLGDTIYLITCSSDVVQIIAEDTAKICQN